MSVLVVVVSGMDGPNFLNEYDDRATADYAVVHFERQGFKARVVEW